MCQTLSWVLNKAKLQQNRKRKKNRKNLCQLKSDIQPPSLSLISFVTNFLREEVITFPNNTPKQKQQTISLQHNALMANHFQAPSFPVMCPHSSMVLNFLCVFKKLQCFFTTNASHNSLNENDFWLLEKDPRAFNQGKQISMATMCLVPF